MNVKKIIIGFLVASAAVPIGIKLWNLWQDKSTPSEPSVPEPSQITHVVQDTLQQHRGEDNAFVHAFEDALEQETRSEEDLARTNGLKTPTA